MQTMRCEHCDQEIPAAADWCPYCEGAQALPAGPHSVSRGTTWFLYLIAAVVAATITAYFYFALLAAD